jgi:hypothetical protein
MRRDFFAAPEQSIRTRAVRVVHPAAVPLLAVPFSALVPYRLTYTIRNLQ